MPPIDFRWRARFDVGDKRRAGWQSARRHSFVLYRQRFSSLVGSAFGVPRESRRLHFIEQHGQDTAKRVTFFGQEKTATTIRLAKMNLAVHGLEGDIREANTFYQDEHELVGKCDFVMANPPFNVDAVDAGKVKDDIRLPFGLPGINKGGKVSNGNYLWISYFHSYLNDAGRAGFVMSSQASSAGHGEMEVRRKLVQTGDVDVMMAIRGNFFYTRTVPCELWFFDKGKPSGRADQVLMLDARQVYRKVTRKIFDFSPEQQKNLAAVVWLYRGGEDNEDRYWQLVHSYFMELATVGDELPRYWKRWTKEAKAVIALLTPDTPGDGPLHAELAQASASVQATLDGVRGLVGGCQIDLDPFESDMHMVRGVCDRLTPQLKAFAKEIEQFGKLAAREVQLATERNGDGIAAKGAPRRALGKQLQAMEPARDEVLGAVKLVLYFHRQAVWLLDRFPDGKFTDVAGLCKAVTRKEIEAADWSLTPGRYVGVAPAEVDEDFDFAEAMRAIHEELAELNAEAVGLSDRIQGNLAGLIG